MKIAVLGWGSLVWDPRNLDMSGDWQPDGPLLPVEYARISGRSSCTSKSPYPPTNDECAGLSQTERLTLVLHDSAQLVPTLWALSSHGNVDDARINLAKREGSPPAEIDWLLKGVAKEELSDTTPSEPGIGQSAVESLTQVIRRRVGTWLSEPGRDLDAAIWTSLGSNFAAESGFGDLSDTNVIMYLEKLRRCGLAGATEEYVRRTPPQVRTGLRERIEAKFEWSPEINSDSTQFEEWKECRATVGRLDSLLQDLRKFGFSLVMGLLTASALVGGVANSRPILPLAAMVVMALVLALFGVDLYYQVLLSGAVERTLDLERMTRPWIRVTKYISKLALQTHAVSVTFLLYVALLVTALGVGIVGSPTTVGWYASVIGVAAASFLVMYGYWLYVRQKSKLHTEKARFWPEDGRGTGK